MMTIFSMGEGLFLPPGQAWQQKGNSPHCSSLCRARSRSLPAPKELIRVILDVALTAVHVSDYY